MVVIILITTVYLIYTGYTYYNTPLEERFYHSQHNWFKPSGIYGQGLGIIGTFMIVFGVAIYIARKRYGFLSKYIRLKYLLEFHIFLCTLGPILILFHTAFKFGGIVSIAFWSMVAVVLSGVIGRFIYIQIPRTIEGRELSLNEVKNMKINLTNVLSDKLNLENNIVETIVKFTDDQNTSNNKTTRNLRKVLKSNNLPKKERISILKMVKNEMSLSRKIARLETMQKLFKYWHVAHLPFALIMLFILVIHVGVTLAFGYKWIF
ncbi:MAG: hypothetical protein GQ552_07180 [Flavobacteriaceae bacterium]|nr:hypothetical protein [Flavobacteriaceae bacterium]